MASGKSLQVEVVSHEGRLWHGAALSVQVPTVDGSLGVLPGRQPLLAQMGEGTVTVTCTSEVMSFGSVGDSPQSTRISSRSWLITLQ